VSKFTLTEKAQATGGCNI